MGEGERGALTSRCLLFVRSSLEGIFFFFFGTTKRRRGDRKELCGHQQTKQERKKGQVCWFNSWKRLAGRLRRAFVSNNQSSAAPPQE